MRRAGPRSNVKGWWIVIFTMAITVFVLFAFPFKRTATRVTPQNFMSRSVESSNIPCGDLSEVVSSPLWYKGTEVVVAKTKPPILYAIPSSVSSCRNSIGRAVKTQGVFAPYETMIMYHILKDKCKNDPNTVVYDVGSNIGYFSIMAGKLGCKVYGFDPSDWHLQHVRLSRSLNKIPTKNIQVFKNAIGNAPATVNFAFDCVHTGGSKIIEQKSAETEEVQQITLDSFWKDHPEVPFYIKIDVEGVEHLLFEGAKLLMNEAIDTIVCEFKFAIRRDVKFKVIDDFIAKGYKVYTYAEQYDKPLASWDLKTIKMRPVISSHATAMWEDIVITKNPIIINAWG